MKEGDEHEKNPIKSRGLPVGGNLRGPGLRSRAETVGNVFMKGEGL